MEKRNTAWLVSILVVGPVVEICPPPVGGAS